MSLHGVGHGDEVVSVHACQVDAKRLKLVEDDLAQLLTCWQSARQADSGARIDEQSAADAGGDKAYEPDIVRVF
jgi:hypothetical protein